MIILSKLKKRKLHFGKAFTIGFFLFLPAPFLWLNNDYAAALEVQLFDAGSLIAHARASGSAEHSWQIFALEEAQTNISGPVLHDLLNTVIRELQESVAAPGTRPGG